MGVVRTLLFMFQIVDECGISTRMFFRTSFIKITYHDVNKMICCVKNKPQFHFWAGCLKLCQFRSEAQHHLIKKMENLMRARQHFRVNIFYLLFIYLLNLPLQFTVHHKPNHIMAPYLLTVCDNAYFDLSG